MPLGLTTEEFQLAQAMTDIALANAASSFSTITKDEVTFSQITLNPSQLKFNKKYISAQEHLYILITEFMGEILADSFLILNPQAATQAVNVMYPNPEITDQMKDAVLLELDNILAASVATKFSDIIEKDIKGDVPQLERKNFIQTQRFIDQKLKSKDTHFSFVTLFQSKKLQIEAQFVCAFKSEFANTIKKMAQEQKKVLEISELHSAQQTQKFMKV